MGAQQAIEQIKRIKTQLQPSAPKLPASTVLQLLDNISNEICCVIDAAEACRNLHSDEAFVASSQAAFEAMSAFISELNADPQLYQRLCEVVDDPTAWAALDSEQRAFAADMKADFLSDGIHLPAQQQSAVHTLQAEIVQAESAFASNNSNLAEADEQILLGPLAREPHYSNVRAWLAQYVVQSTPAAERMLTVSLDRRLVLPLLRSLGDEGARRTLWATACVTPTANISPLLQMISKRQALARSLGYPNFAVRALGKNILRTPEEVQELLREVAKCARPSAQRELTRLLQQKRLGAPSAVLQPWDMAHLSQGIRQATTQSAPVNFPLSACVASLQRLTAHLFGLTAEEVPLAEGEGWGAEVTKLLLSRRGVPQGVVFLDPYGRDGKFPGAAHFVVQCGCDLPHSLGGAARQLPVVVLGFQLTPGTPLSLGEVETLYHEWGHALHSVCSATRFQHLSGTRGGADFVEIPSHLLEHFVRDVRWLRTIGSRNRDDDALLTAALQGEGRASAGLRMQNQLLYAAADAALFGPSGAALGSGGTLARVMDIVCRAQSDFTALPLGQLDDTTRHHLRRLLPAGAADELDCLPMMNPLTHTHFVNYGGGYYSYILARAYAAQIWQHLFAADPLDLQAGQVLQRFLALGAAGSSTSSGALREVAGGPLDVSHYLRSISSPSE